VKARERRGKLHNKSFPTYFQQIFYVHNGPNDLFIYELMQKMQSCNFRVIFGFNCAEIGLKYTTDYLHSNFLRKDTHKTRPFPEN